jgi:tetratricopeptide (TPR) repeat protein
MYELGQNEDAAKIITSTEKLDLETLGLHYKTAVLFCDKKRFAAALSTMDMAYKANYAGSEAVSNIEFVLENIGLVDRAIATWDRLTETAKASISERYQ